MPLGRTLRNERKRLFWKKTNFLIQKTLLVKIWGLLKSKNFSDCWFEQKAYVSAWAGLIEKTIRKNFLEKLFLPGIQYFDHYDGLRVSTFWLKKFILIKKFAFRWHRIWLLKNFPEKLPRKTFSPARTIEWSPNPAREAHRRIFWVV